MPGAQGDSCGKVLVKKYAPPVRYPGTRAHWCRSWLGGNFQSSDDYVNLLKNVSSKFNMRVSAKRCKSHRQTRVSQMTCRSCRQFVHRQSHPPGYG
eukprot:3225009-Rhodomonas_salina.1